MSPITEAHIPNLATDAAPEPVSVGTDPDPVVWFPVLFVFVPLVAVGIVMHIGPWPVLLETSHYKNSFVNKNALKTNI